MCDSSLDRSEQPSGEMEHLDAVLEIVDEVESDVLAEDKMGATREMMVEGTCERIRRRVRQMELSETDQKFLNGERSHPQGDTIAYCPECEKELDDFGLTTDGNGAGRHRMCGTVAWMSFEAQELLISDFVTLPTFRDARGEQ